MMDAFLAFSLLGGIALLRLRLEKTMSWDARVVL
jgi:hypothetical protein